MKYFKKDKFLTWLINQILFWSYPILTHHVFTRVCIEMKERWGEKLFKNVFPILFQTIALVLIFIFYFSCYYFDFAFLDRFKVNDLDWPWKYDTKGWKKMRKKLINRYLFNYIVIAPVFAKTVYYTAGTDYSSNLPSL